MFHKKSDDTTLSYTFDQKPNYALINSFINILWCKFDNMIGSKWVIPFHIHVSQYIISINTIKTYFADKLEFDSRCNFFTFSNT